MSFSVSLMTVCRERDISTDTHGRADVLKYLQFYSNQKKNWVKKHTHTLYYARTIPNEEKIQTIFCIVFLSLCFNIFTWSTKFSVLIFLLNFNYTKYYLRFSLIKFIFCWFSMANSEPSKYNNLSFRISNRKLAIKYIRT